MKTLLLIGGPGSAIGARLLETLARQGFRVVATWHSQEPQQAPLGPGVTLHRLDVTDLDAVQQLVDRVEREVGEVDTLINNAACSSERVVALTSEQEWQRVMDVNLTGVFNTCRCVSRKMLRRKRGQIINIASLKAQTGGRGLASYAASKAGVIAFSKALACELAPGGIAVHVVCPGYVPSRLSGADERRREEEAADALLDIQHNADDVAEFIGFLCAERLKAVTGQVFHIDSRIH
jgi:3-oxoacyl-[acyl-carrier protein] reductase